MKLKRIAVLRYAGNFTKTSINCGVGISRLISGVCVDFCVNFVTDLKHEACVPDFYTHTFDALLAPINM